MLVKAACSPGQAFSNQVSLFLSLLHPSSFLAISYCDLGFFFFPLPSSVSRSLSRDPRHCCHPCHPWAAAGHPRNPAPAPAPASCIPPLLPGKRECSSLTRGTDQGTEGWQGVSGSDPPGKAGCEHSVIRGCWRCLGFLGGTTGSSDPCCPLPSSEYLPITPIHSFEPPGGMPGVRTKGQERLG